MVLKSQVIYLFTLYNICWNTTYTHKIILKYRYKCKPISVSTDLLKCPAGQLIEVFVNVHKE